MAREHIRPYRQFAVLLCVALALAGCQTFRAMLGFTKNSPNEFAVASHGPLVIPPNFDKLPLPKPGAPLRRELTPMGQAQAALFPALRTAEDEKPNYRYSDTEIALLRDSKALTAGPGIRETLLADARLSERQFQRMAAEQRAAASTRIASAPQAPVAETPEPMPEPLASAPMIVAQSQMPVDTMPMPEPMPEATPEPPPLAEAPAQVASVMPPALADVPMLRRRLEN